MRKVEKKGRVKQVEIRAKGRKWRESKITEAEGLNKGKREKWKEGLKGRKDIRKRDE